MISRDTDRRKSAVRFVGPFHKTSRRLFRRSTRTTGKPLLPEIQLDVQFEELLRSHLEITHHQVSLLFVESSVQLRRDHHDWSKRIVRELAPPTRLLKTAQVPRQRPIIRLGSNDFDEEIVAAGIA